MYCCKFSYLFSGTDAADSPVFAMRNPAASIMDVQVRKICLDMATNVTTATAVMQGFGISRYTVADPTGTGATSPARVGHSTGAAASAILDANIKYGTSNVLTLTSAVFEGNFIEAAIPNALGAVQFREFEFNRQPFILKPGEGLVIRNITTAVVGFGCRGSVWWEEASKT